MTITFADGTRIEVAASALDDFVKHDLKWVEFVHGRATKKQNSPKPAPVSVDSSKQNIHHCLSRAC